MGVLKAVFHCIWIVDRRIFLEKGSCTISLIFKCRRPVTKFWMSGAYTKINNNFFAHLNKEVIAPHKTQAHVKRTGILIWLQTN